MRKIGKLNVDLLGNYKEKIITKDVVLTDEILYGHILVKHEKEYEQLKKYLNIIVEEPDIIIDDNRNSNTIILLKKIKEIGKNGRVVVKIAVAEEIERHPKNSIITLMRLNDRTWMQTIKNRGNIIYENTRQK